MSGFYVTNFNRDAHDVNANVSYAGRDDDESHESLLMETGIRVLRTVVPVVVTPSLRLVVNSHDATMKAKITKP